ncbi:hypothetical protein VP01_6g5 [Puccinia sorghi]|uniref:Uncharacterized protein n=1 Tax=Puccinia sorghi TaxID=27349 RepID=A0A0L6UDV1_9BASI|nr:hypothetical protein VP01_6g5 [Puccinia sorghi]
MDESGAPKHPESMKKKPTAPLQWNDVKFFPFSHLAPKLEDMRGTAAVCGGNKVPPLPSLILAQMSNCRSIMFIAVFFSCLDEKIWVIRIDPVEEKCRLLAEIIDKSSTVTGGRAEVFHTISWSVDPVSTQPVLAAGGVRGVVKLYDARTYVELGMLYGHGGTILALAFSPTHPHIIASASIDHTVRIWNTTLSLKPSHTRPDSESQPLLPYWDNPPGQLVTILAGVGGHTAPVCSVRRSNTLVHFFWPCMRIQAWHPVHPLLATGGMDNHVKIWYLSELPGFPANSPLQDDGLPLPLQTVCKKQEDSDMHAAPITSLPIFNSKHVHSHWVDQMIWAGRQSAILVSKSAVISKVGCHPLAAYASDEDQQPTSRICVWQASLLADLFSGNSAAPITPQDEEANLGGVDFEVFHALKVPRPSLEQEQENVEWGLGMCLALTLPPHQGSSSSAPNLAVLVGNHPAGIAEVSLFDELPTLPSTFILHPSSTCLQRNEVGLDGQEIFRAIDSTEYPTPSLQTNPSIFLLRVGQNASIELWKHHLSSPSH